MRLIYHPEAEAELLEAALFYEKRISTLGARFLEAIDHAISVIQQAPEQWRIVKSGVRRYLVQSFPYAIYYRLVPDGIRVLAFKHHGRRADYWHDRLSD